MTTSTKIPAVLFDTNVFLEFLLGQKEAELCTAIFQTVTEGAAGFATAYGLHGIETILNRRALDARLCTFLSDLREMASFSIYTTSLDEEREIAELLEVLPLDFDDALHFYVARKLHIPLITLDRDFKKVRGIDCYSPKEWLGEIRP